MSYEARVAVLVGAGLTRDAGLPVSVELCDELKRALVQAACDDATDGTAAKAQLAAFRFLNGGIRFQEGFLDRDPDKPVNIEQIAVAALQLQARLKNPLAPYTSGWHQRLAELESRNPDVLNRFVEFIYSQLKTWLSRFTNDTVAYLARLFDICANGIGVDVFSLNYDLGIETAIREYVGRDFINGFTQDGWRPDKLQALEAIRLFKLHGSLDWVEDDLNGVCSLEHPRHKNAEDFEGDQEPLIIFGTNQKLSAKEPFLTLAYHFSQAAMRTPVLAVIGYSFQDDYVNEIVFQGLRTNTRLRMLVVSPTASEDTQRFALMANNPRLMILDGQAGKAKDVLNGGVFLRTVRRLLDEATTEEPFGPG